MEFCKKCGECCGPVLITKEEKEKIERYLKFKNIKMPDSDKMDLICKFKGKDNQCIIYDVRPEVCRLFGTYENLLCPNYKLKPKPAKIPKLSKLKKIKFVLNEI